MMMNILLRDTFSENTDAVSHCPALADVLTWPEWSVSNQQQGPYVVLMLHFH